MWEYNSKDPGIRIILLIIYGLLMLGLVFFILNLLFDGQGNILIDHYNMMPGYYSSSNSIFTVFAQLLLFVSSLSLIISLVLYFVKNTAGFQSPHKNEYNSEVISSRACEKCGFKIHKDWKCCPKCGTDIEEHDIQKESTIYDDFNEVEKGQCEHMVVEHEGKDDIVERLYHVDSNKPKKNSKKNKKNS